MKKISAILFLFFTIFSTVFAKRAAPPEEDLRPITVDGYEYSVDFYNHIIYGKVCVLRKNLETGKIQSFRSRYCKIQSKTNKRKII